MIALHFEIPFWFHLFSIENKKTNLFVEKYVPSISKLDVDDIEADSAIARWEVDDQNEDYQQVRDYVIEYWKIGAEENKVKINESQLSSCQLL